MYDFAAYVACAYVGSSLAVHGCACLVYVYTLTSVRQRKFNTEIDSHCILRVHGAATCREQSERTYYCKPQFVLEDNK